MTTNRQMTGQFGGRSFAVVKEVAFVPESLAVRPVRACHVCCLCFGGGQQFSNLESVCSSGRKMQVHVVCGPALRHVGFECVVTARYAVALQILGWLRQMHQFAPKCWKNQLAIVWAIEVRR